MKKFRLISIFLLLIVVITSPVFAGEKFDREDFRRFVNSELERWNVPGTAILIIKDGKVVMSEGFGFRDTEKKLKVTPKTIFAIGSASKAFTATAVGILVDEKKVDFDKPVRDYLPDLMLYDPYVTEHVTLRDMLTHRTGVPRHDLVWVYSGLNRNQLFDIMRFLQPSCGFRELMQYNNFMFMTAGMAVGRVSDSTWEEFVQTRIFNPLGMNSSNFTVKKSQQADDYALPYTLSLEGLKDIPQKTSQIPRVKMPFNDIVNIGPAGSISSNLEDMEKWILLQLNDGKVNGKQVISKETMKQLHSPQMTITVDGEFKNFIFPEMKVAAYGMGWFVQPYRGHYFIHHGGNIDGFSALVSFMPKEKNGVVVLTNLNETAMPYTVTFNIYDRLLGLNQLHWSDRFEKMKQEKIALMKTAYKKSEKERKKNTTPSHPLEDYQGEYSNPAYGSLKIKEMKGKLLMSFRIFNCPLEHYQYDVFKTATNMPYDMMSFKLTFKMNVNGDIESLSIPLQEGVDDIVFVKNSTKK